MQLSVEISLYPLHQGYKDIIKSYLYDLNEAASDVEIRSSNMSTRVFGEFDEVTALLNAAMKKSMLEHGKMVFVCKYLAGDARELTGYD